jgi:HEAT repeat protein
MKASMRLYVFAVALLGLCPRPASAQPLPFEDVVRNLRNPDPEIRISAVRVLRDAKYPEAMVPMAPLVADPVNEIQFEAIAAELSFYLVDDVPAKRKVAFVLEVRSDARAERAFGGGPLAVWPKQAPAELIEGLLKAVDDENQRVRVEAIYALGVVGYDSIRGEHASQLIKALDHYDPAVREGAARVVGRFRLAGSSDALIKAMNDSNERVRQAAMQALGELREETAVKALTEHFNYRPKGQGGWAALDALARIAHPSSVPLFREKLTDKDPFFRRAAAEGLGRTADKESVDALQSAIGGDESEMVRGALAFALSRVGAGHAMRLVDFLDSDQMALQIQGYMMEIGPGVVPDVIPHLQEPDVNTRRHLAAVLGELGDPTTIPVLTAMQKDKNGDVAKAATNAIERIKMRVE